MYDSFADMIKTLIITAFLFCQLHSRAEDGYSLWLRYNLTENVALRERYLQQTHSIWIGTDSETLKAAAEELEKGIVGMTGTRPVFSTAAQSVLFAGNFASLEKLGFTFTDTDRASVGNEGYRIRTLAYRNKKVLVIAAKEDIGVLYGVFGLLRQMQTGKSLDKPEISETPHYTHRILNHWDNLDRYVERGYAGISIWDWHTLPDLKKDIYRDYARANASIGINGTVLTNVNANAYVLTDEWIKKVAALAEIFRPYGIRVYLTARFSAPMEIGKLKTADPFDPEVRQWWKTRIADIYRQIPDLGGFLVKANSEGQPGPQNYGRSHADGANMLAEALAPYNGLVMWRAFVYDADTEDRFRQAYSQFKPLDGKFLPNVLVQVKNGPIDFQPREPFSPLFGAMKQTPLLMEVQLTQEYLGFATHLVYLPEMFNEVLNEPTFTSEDETPVKSTIRGIAGVSNIGNDRNWTGHPFGQANWYGFGRQAWNPDLRPEDIAREWVLQTFTSDKATADSICTIMLGSHETLVRYMTPLGLHHIMGYGHHYGPAPWYNKAPRADWNPVYFHNASAKGIGFDRTRTGSDALAQYSPKVRSQWEDPKTCPDKWLLWFHHVPWTHQMQTGKALWEELCAHYHRGVAEVEAMQKTWSLLESKIDPERFRDVAHRLAIQHAEANWWRNACLAYFGAVSGLPWHPEGWKPEQTLEHYERLDFPYAPGNGR